MAKKLFIEGGSQKEKDQSSGQKKYDFEHGVFEELNLWLASKQSLKLKDKVTFYRLFAAMINAGMSVVKALEILADQVESYKLRSLLHNMKAFIEKGGTLSASFAQYPSDFSDAEVGMIQAGEASGRLNTTLTSLAEQTERSESLTKKLKGAMIYPAVIFLLLIAALFAVMTLVIPKIKEMFESFNAELPFATQLLIDISDFMVANGGPFDLPNALNIILLIIAFIVFIGYFKKTPMGRPLWDGFLLNLPIFGGLNKKVAIAKMCRGLATLTSSGISIMKALTIVSSMIGNELYRRRILRIADDVKIGINIADNMRGDHRFFPPMVVSMIGVGEQTAQLDKVSLKIAEFYEDEVQDLIKNLSALLEPIIIVVVGLTVGGLVIAVMLPIISLSDLAGGV